MYLTHRQVSTLDKAGLVSFLSRRIPEGHHIDYKAALSGDTKVRQIREFLKDTAAFANANGGDILIGVREPDESSKIEDLLIGIVDGQELAHDLERIASSGAIDPRISGLVIQPVPIDNNRFVIVVHIPPSSVKPHMVVYDKHTFFHQRHSESVQPMTAYDIREAVLTSASSEDRARRYAETQRSRLLESFNHGSPCFVLQATPLVQPEAPLDVFSAEVLEAVRSSKRNSQHGGHTLGLGSMPYPKPTVEGIRGTENREEPQWITEVHRNGYIGVIFRLTDYDKIGVNREGPYCIREHHQHLFYAFAEFCEAVIAATDFDPPILLDCLLENAQGSYYVMSQIHQSDACERDRIEWPTAIRLPGSSIRAVMDEFIHILYNAYGLRKTEVSF
jgi:hypothetical protein